jgi:nicotinate-nucleotide adenylyltransferase
LRIGVFGGTFDPPHIGHLILAEAAQAQLELDRILWVLTPAPPHNRDRSITPVEARYDMLLAAIAGNPAFEPSRIDLDRPPPHYALDSVLLLSGAHPGDQLIYLMGGDSLRDLPTWHRPLDFVTACDAIGVMHRVGDQVDLVVLDTVIPGLKSKVRLIDVPLIEISSSSIRQLAAGGHPYRYFLPPAVFEYIRQNLLYLAVS